MARENVEIVQEWFRTYNAGGLDAVVDRYWHENIELWDPPGLPDADRHVGREAARMRVESFHEFGWDGQVRVEEMIEAGEAVVVVWRMLGVSGTGTAGSVPLDILVAFVVMFEGGRVRIVRMYLSREEALAAVGPAGVVEG